MFETKQNKRQKVLLAFLTGISNWSVSEHGTSACNSFTSFCCTTHPNVVNTHGSPAYMVKKEQYRDPDLSFLLPGVLCMAVPRQESFLWRHLFWHQFWDKVVLSSTPPSQALGKNKGTEQRANVFEVTGPRAQLLTLQQWVMLWFSYVLLGAKWNNTGSAVGLGIKHCTSRSAPSREHNWCLPCTWFLARTVCGVACLLSITKEEKSGSWPDLLASSSASPQLLFPMCACMYTGETWTQIKTKAETNHSVILSTVIPIRLSKLKHNYMYIFCSIWDNFISKPFLLLSVLAVQSSKILSHWKWSEERMHFLTWIPLADDAIRLLSAQ